MNPPPDTTAGSELTIDEEGQRLKALLKAERQSYAEGRIPEVRVCPFCGAPLLSLGETTQRCCDSCYKSIHNPD